MSRGLRSRTICVRFLMFVMAIQAMSPDARDLTSPALLRLLDIPADANLAAGVGEVTASDPTPESGDSLPLGSNDRDTLPDEVCLPGGCPTFMLVHRGQSGSHRPASFASGLSEASGQDRGRKVVHRGAGHTRAASLNRPLVRLTC